MVTPLWLPLPRHFPVIGDDARNQRLRADRIELVDTLQFKEQRQGEPQGIVLMALEPLALGPRHSCSPAGGSRSRWSVSRHFRQASQSRPTKSTCGRVPQNSIVPSPSASSLLQSIQRGSCRSARIHSSMVSTATMTRPPPHLDLLHPPSLYAMNLAVLEEPRPTKGTGEDVPDVTGGDGGIEGGEHLVIEDYHVLEGRRRHDSIEAQPAVLSGTGKYGARRVVLFHNILLLGP